MNNQIAIPAPLRTRPHAATRHLYLGKKPGHVTCLFDPHLQPHARVKLDAWPLEVEQNAAHKRSIDKRLFALSYVIEGNADLRYTDTGEQYVLEPGHFFLFSNNTLAQVVLQPHPGFFECSISLDGDTGRHIRDLGLWPDGPRCFLAGRRSEILALYLKAFSTIASGTPTVHTHLRCFLDIVELADSIRSARDPSAAFRSRATALLRQLSGPQDRIADIARQMDMTYEAFRQRFLKQFGFSPQEYQLRMRMEKACSLLFSCSVKETAIQLGYEDPAIFSRQFKHRLGTSPRDYCRK